MCLLSDLGPASDGEVAAKVVGVEAHRQDQFVAPHVLVGKTNRATVGEVPIRFLLRVRSSGVAVEARRVHTVDYTLKGLCGDKLGALHVVRDPPSSYQPLDSQTEQSRSTRQCSCRSCHGQRT